jgi:hypothetical protein
MPRKYKVPKCQICDMVPKDPCAVDQGMCGPCSKKLYIAYGEAMYGSDVDLAITAARISRRSERKRARTAAATKA